MSSPAPSFDRPEEGSTTLRLTEFLEALFRGFEKVPSKEQLQMYFNALKDLSLPQLQHGFSEVVKRIKFFPSPAEIREVALEIQTGWMTASQKAHPADCQVCGGNGWVHSKLLQKALRCDAYVRWKAEVSAIADELSAKFDALDFESGPLERIPSPVDQDPS